MPAIAAGIIDEAGLSIDDCKAAQKRSGSFNDEMLEFIKNELGILFDQAEMLHDQMNKIF